MARYWMDGVEISEFSPGCIVEWTLHNSQPSKAVLAEKERCAKVAEDCDLGCHCGDWIAEKIRGRSDADQNQNEGFMLTADGIHKIDTRGLEAARAKIFDALINLPQEGDKP